MLALAAGCGEPATVVPAHPRDFISLPDSDGGDPVAFRWSSNGAVGPGLTIADAAQPGENDCTIGWPVVSSSGRRGYLSAGHCAGGLGRDTWVYTDGDRRGRVLLGPYVEHEDDTLADGTMFDAAAAFLPGTRRSVRWGTAIGVGHPIAGTLTPQEVSGLAPGTPLCMLGARSGITCGPLMHADDRYLEWGGYAVTGDSGSAVFAVNPDESVCAVGILHDGPTDRDNTIAYVEPALRKWHLTLPRETGPVSGDRC
ncbi:hypothetical protein GCM10023147_48770 [Tsukamurella soli]|uniref:Trypsin n=1 Tax=Tsukamurella soli TaxID=644556 RepID=A0ABP8KFY6_9ACTN